MTDRVTEKQLRNLVAQVAEQYEDTGMFPDASGCEYHDIALKLHVGNGKYRYQLRAMYCNEGHGESAIGPNVYMTAREMKRYLQGLIEGAQHF